MPVESHASRFTQNVLDDIFPPQRANQFFEALFGDAEEGAYDIVLTYAGETDDRIEFEFHLNRRPGRCLACNLTYGLPEVFKRHPVIDLDGVVARIDDCMSNGLRCKSWKLGRTRDLSSETHVVPLTITIAAD